MWEGRDRYMRNEKIVRATKLILDFMFFSGSMVVVTLPWTLNLAGRYYDAVILEQYVPMLLTLAVSGIFGILIVGQLRKMMRTVVSGSCFVYENVKSLRLMTGFSLCISAAFLIEMFFVPTIATVVIVVIFFVAALFSQVLSQVFGEAVRYKEENDLTI